MSTGSSDCGADPEPDLQEDVEELYDMAPCGYLSTAPDGRIVKVNRTFLQWTGYERDELICGKRIVDLLIIGSKIFYETHFILLLRMHGSVNEIALDVRCKDGRVLPTLVNATQKRNGAGMPVWNRITLFNATERRMYERELLLAKRQAEQAAAELTQSNAALLRANEELGQFAYAASHDLQEPLRTITSFSQLLVRRYRPQLDEQAGAYISHILDGARRMQSLIDDLLSFSQGQASQLMLRRTDLKEVLQLALSNLHSAIVESGAVVTHENLPILTVDAARLTQVLQNLVGNAIKYRKPHEAPRVLVSGTKHQDHWMITVEDNGMGFEKRYAEQIFGMFKRLHGREVPGTGIGLALCKKHVEAHGGIIRADSTPGVGSSFFFTIPERLPARSATPDQ